MPDDAPKPMYYACAHGESNTPCHCHFTAAVLSGQPEPVAHPDSWFETYVSPPGGLSDAVTGVPLTP